ncbi:MFS transporter [Erwiniaceae bacterium BAC15a-03b]|uniref:MFS transporter n=1 Tax=Winslowiella arboricola TaxID=2978220 RepID=A0A9J6PMJ2_9GAMM|nr:MFS transporter [Winslowiella arboricola]MCU5774592.1 MFS transporter [Winslowiella arboricola]MCU5777998.1 MFS transporter [Winslowiella arboricola]
MRHTSAPYILLGTLLTAGGYGATFLISAWFRAQGGSDIDAGNTLSMALAGTLTGVPVVGWFAGKIDAARLAALAALTLACGYALLGNLRGIDPVYLPRLATLLIGLGWGMFYLAAPLALSERLTDAERGPGFTRFSAFQMTGICSSPVLLTALMGQGGLPLQTTFLWVAGMGLVAALLLGIFGVREPRGRTEVLLRPWAGKITTLSKSSVIRPIVMVGLGGAVFSGMMAFQSSLTEGTRASASTFFAVHAATAVVSRLTLARRLSVWPRTPLVIVLLGSLIAGLVCLLGIPVHPAFQIVAAILTGAGYGLLYPVIQTWAVNDSQQEDRHAALTWFVVAYFVGIFGFPAFGGWLLVSAGKAGFVWALVALATLELAMAVTGKTQTARRAAPLPK